MGVLFVSFNFIVYILLHLILVVLTSQLGNQYSSTGFGSFPHFRIVDKAFEECDISQTGTLLPAVSTFWTKFD